MKSVVALQNGRIVCQITGAGQFGMPDGAALFDVADDVDISSSYILDGQAVQMPAQPAYPCAFDYDTKQWAPLGQVSVFRESARRRIDEAAGRARARYLTIAPGQDATYTAKYADARAFLEAGSPAIASPWPWVAAEATATGMTPHATATRIVQIGDAWAHTIGPAIEATRIAGKDAMASFSTEAQIAAHTNSVIAALDAI